MLDDWLERITREPPEKRAKGQLRDLGNVTRDTVKALTKHPDDHQTGDILHNHDTQVAQIMRRGRKPPPERCRVCGKVLPKPIGNPWTNNPGITLLWALLIALIVLGLFPLIGWWVLVVFPIGWLVSLSFFWTIPLPVLIVFGLLLFRELTGNT